MRLIDIDDVRHTYCGDCGEYERWNIDPNLLVDAVPVIRCKDCKHWQYDSCFVDSEEGDAESIILDRFAFDFCSRAERREE